MEEEETYNLSIPQPSHSGYTCWDATKCKLCSRFQDRATILNLYLRHFVILGTTADLLSWSQEGERCTLCVYIVRQFLEEVGGPDYFNFDATFVMRWSLGKGDGETHSSIGAFEFEMSWGGMMRRVKKVPMRVFAAEKGDAAACVSYRPPNPYVFSAEAFAKARGWIEECDGNHPQCRATGPTKLPTRILEVSSDDKDISVRLVESHGEEAHYAALSYVWGDPKQQCMTTISNLDDHFSNIPLQNLPNSVADAVSCTHQLGLKYLWVDALCIIQDSFEDKQKEVSNMANIYKNSYITISAAKSSGAGEGFREPRPLLEGLMGTCFKVDMAVPKDVKGLLLWLDGHRDNPEYKNLDYRDKVEWLFRETPWYADEDMWVEGSSVVWLAGRPEDQEGLDLVEATELKLEPINKRGWTLQESWLSRRMLIYGSGQMLWRCRECFKSDGGRPPMQPREDRLEDVKLPMDFNSIHMFRHLWRRLVFDYSSRRLGDHSDKFNALDGIVQELKRQTGDEYLAGIWAGDIIAGLSWYQDASKKGFESMLVNQERTVPSWSWAKVDGPVFFSVGEEIKATIKEAKVTRNETEVQAGDPRLVVEGEITIAAPICELPARELLEYFDVVTEHGSPRAFSHYIHFDGGFTNPDISIGEVNGEGVFNYPLGMRFMELSRGKWDGRQNLAAESRGLVIAPVEGRPKTYRRIGYFVVALEYDASMEENMVFCLSIDRGDIKKTAFGMKWAWNMGFEEVTLI